MLFDDDVIQLTLNETIHNAIFWYTLFKSEIMIKKTITNEEMLKCIALNNNKNEYTS